MTLAEKEEKVKQRKEVRALLDQREALREEKKEEKAWKERKLEHTI